MHSWVGFLISVDLCAGRARGVLLAGHFLKLFCHIVKIGLLPAGGGQLVMELLVVLLKVIFVPLLAVAPELPAKYDDDCYYDAAIWDLVGGCFLSERGGPEFPLSL